ncbi:MAG: methyltransferase domain-containing protein [Bacteroidetes bacterium CHB5]|nr:methyltransferase domain-containing protein [Bacteroidetes bacterium CHB5]
MKKIVSFLIRFVPRPWLQRMAGTGLKVASLFYAGNKVECPVCNSRFKKFMPYGRINPRPNALCPHCLSLERHRLIWMYLQQETNFFKTPLQVLHVAPEVCFMKRFEKQHGVRYITTDIESPLAKVKADIHQLPFADNTFDAVLCNHVLEHVADDIQAMREIKRVLKPGGWAILQVPFFSPVPETTFEDNTITDKREREKIFGQDDHVRKYGQDYASRINASGLIAEKNNFAQSLSKEIIARASIMENEVLYIGKKTIA